MLHLITGVHSNWTPQSPKDVNAVRAVLTQLENNLASSWSPRASIQLVNEPAVIGAAIRRVRRLLSACHLLPGSVLSLIFEHFVIGLDSSVWRLKALEIRGDFNAGVVDQSTAHRPSGLEPREYFPPALDAALHLLSRHTERIRYLCLDMQHPWQGRLNTRPAHIFPPLKRDAFSSYLECVDIAVSPNTIAWEWISAVVGSAPKLTHFLFHGRVVPNGRWGQLQNLSLGDITLAQSLHVLANAPLLGECDFILTSSADRIPLPEHPRVHSLTCLILQHDGTSGPDDATLFLHHVTLPSLISLAIVGARGEWRQCAILPFLIRSACTLRRLNLVWTRVSDVQLSDLLYHPQIQMERLTALKLEDCPSAVTEELLRCLHLIEPGWHYGLRIRALRTIFLSPIMCDSGVGTLAARLDNKGRYECDVLEGIPDMSTTFTLHPDDEL
ncbi:hypothetical protein B0H17DRAFT_1202127 [Mycena rosella]|uniref:F-box domain-containing protein n=1 Tax=Mycena rosella TaxID=1033263 RepID=A0AAD7GIL8_MYCRO|nr:hypothetical protein B0H17DRAFT_1202127 [Mycena rosella]